jgi:hypothetical protein
MTFIGNISREEVKKPLKYKLDKSKIAAIRQVF